MAIKKLVWIGFIVAWAVLLPAWALAGGTTQSDHGKAPASKDAILLVAFGTSVPEATKAFDAIEARVRQAFPRVEVRWAYTSKIVRDKLRKQGKGLEDPASALARMLDERFTHIVVASLHTIPGEEFHDLYRDVEAFKGMSGSDGGKLVVSWPLLTSREKMETVAKGVLNHVPKSRRLQDAVILMGHGSERHPADAAYAAMNYWIQGIDSNFFVATVAGQPQLKDLIPGLKKKGIKKAYLMPLMLVAGDHARNDMCGDEKKSWKSILEAEGIQVQCELKGTGEMPEVVNVWVDNIRAAYDRLK
ncbi:MAG: sirohydrochlorin cobaltochelatase [Thermodesulfobacteriota bacterium]